MRRSEINNKLASLLCDELMNSAKFAQDKSPDEIAAYCKLRSSSFLEGLDSGMNNILASKLRFREVSEPNGAGKGHRVEESVHQNKPDESSRSWEVVSRRLFKAQLLMQNINGYDCYDKSSVGIIPKELHPFDLCMEIAITKTRFIFGQS